MGVLAWGALIAVALYPLCRRIAGAIGNRPKSAATLIVLILLVLVIIPLSYLPGSFDSASEAISDLTNDWTELRLPPPPPWMADFPLIGSTIGQKWSAAAETSRNRRQYNQGDPSQGVSRLLFRRGNFDRFAWLGRRVRFHFLPPGSQPPCSQCQCSK